MNSHNSEFLQKVDRIFTNRIFQCVIAIIIFGIIFIAIFRMGAAYGFRKASFGQSWHNNYIQNFGPRPGPRGGKMVIIRNEFPNTHGTMGRVLAVDLPNITVEDRDNTEKVITISNTTSIKNMRDDGKPEDIKVDSVIVVIGEPSEDGTIAAKLIRILPRPEALQ
ncbi:MAG TPA: hypothetical protein VGE63_00535 [Candidatus Paceibacterota bacterium]